jgi:hypothetical protein
MNTFDTVSAPSGAGHHLANGDRSWLHNAPAHRGARHHATALAGHTVSAISGAVQSEAAARGARHTAVAFRRFAAASRIMLHNVSAHYGAGHPISALEIGSTGQTVSALSDEAQPESASRGARTHYLCHASRRRRNPWRWTHWRRAVQRLRSHHTHTTSCSLRNPRCGTTRRRTLPRNRIVQPHVRRRVRLVFFGKVTPVGRNRSFFL